jgi:hypothetical protein
LHDLSRRHGASRFGLDVWTLRLRIRILLMASCFAASSLGWALPVSHSPCRMQPTTFEGWKAEELFNDWVRLTFVPQLGGRLMQVEFGGHRYLFVNPKYRGRYFPPVNSAQQHDQQHEWINYGGDKLWPLPEGHGDGYWPGPVSDVLDDGEYKLSVVSQSNPCTLRLEGPADPATGLQYSREVSIGSDSPQISFHAVMKNATQHAIRWSMQSVTQYDTADSRTYSAAQANYNRDFWAFAPVNPQSAYADGYRVRNGLADDPSYAVHDGMFTLHWQYLENEVWLDSDAGWIAVVDDSAKYGMIERFQYFAGEDYPGKASVIFYKNGAALELDDTGMPALRSNHPDEAPYYMEAEINSPMRRLNPGASYALDTWWFPVRASKEFKTVTPAGIVEHPLAASLSADRLRLSGTFGVFFAGKVNAHIFDLQGVESNVVEVGNVDPLQAVELNKTISASPGATRVTIHLNDEQGIDRGSLGEAEITIVRKDS